MPDQGVAARSVAHPHGRGAARADVGAVGSCCVLAVSNASRTLFLPYDARRAMMPAVVMFASAGADARTAPRSGPAGVRDRRPTVRMQDAGGRRDRVGHPTAKSPARM